MHLHKIAAGAAYFGAATIPWLVGMQVITTSIFLTLQVLLWSFHFFRRVYEVLFVAKYSRHDTLIGIFGVIVYYWGMGYWFGYTVLRGETVISQGLVHALMALCGFTLLCVAEYGNAYHHRILASLRTSSDDTSIKAPSGGLFAFIDCPHYFCELLSWIGFAAMCGFPYSLLVFVGASFFAMLPRAQARHLQYVKLFGSSFESRKYFIPFLL